MTLSRTIATLSLLAVATACGSDNDEPTSADPGGDRAGGPASEAPTLDPTEDAPSFPGSTATQTADNKGEWDLVLTDVRVGAHEGFDRVVLEFRGTGTPGWAVGYVTEPLLDGSGEPVALDGDAFLDVYASGTTWPDPGGDYYDGPEQLTSDDAGALAAVHVGGTFEGDTQVLVGVDGGPAPFRTFALTGPPRLVVDIADEGAA